MKYAHSVYEADWPPAKWTLAAKVGLKVKVEVESEVEFQFQFQFEASSHGASATHTHIHTTTHTQISPAAITGCSLIALLLEPGQALIVVTPTGPRCPAAHRINNS